MERSEAFCVITVQVVGDDLFEFRGNLKHIATALKVNSEIVLGEHKFVIESIQYNFVPHMHILLRALKA